MKILIVLTSHEQLGDTGEKTGFWLEECGNRRIIGYWPKPGFFRGGCACLVEAFSLSRRLGSRWFGWHAV